MDDSKNLQNKIERNFLLSERFYDLGVCADYPDRTCSISNLLLQYKNPVLLVFYKWRYALYR